jgi:hypothetical protein
VTPAERRELDGLKAQVAALQRGVGNARGLGVNTAFGATHYRTTQLGFPAELTAAWDDDDGYAWKRLRLVGVDMTDPAVQPAGAGAVTAGGDTSLEAGTPGWMEPSPDATGYVFTPDVTAMATAFNCRRRLLGLTADACVEFSVSAGAGLCANVAGENLVGVKAGGYWYSLGTFATAAGEAQVRFQVKPFALDLLVGGDTYEGTEVGCAGGGLQYAFSDPALCDDEEAGDCGDNTFTVTVGCGPCDELRCCEPDELPDALCLTVTQDSGDCACIAGVYTLTRVPGSAVYRVVQPNPCGVSFPNISWGLYCSGDIWFLDNGIGGGPINGWSGVYDCSRPLGMRFTPTSVGTSIGEDCTPGFSLTVVVTEMEGEDCGSGSGGGGFPDPPAAIGCCDGVGEDLAAHPPLELVIPDGPYAGTFTLTWNATSQQYISPEIDGPKVLACDENGQWRLTDFTAPGFSLYAVDGSCSPFGLIYTGDNYDATGDITVAVA